MSGIRIKELDSADGVVGSEFDNMRFAVDLEEPDATLSLSGSKLREAIGVAEHTHKMNDIEGLIEGVDALSVQIISSGGNNFINGIATVLRAYVFRGETDITSSLADNLFYWLRSSDNPDGDAVWNSLHQGVGRSINLSDADVCRKAVFTCEVHFS